MTKSEKSNLKLLFILIGIIAIIAMISLFISVRKDHQSYRISSNVKIDGTILPRPRTIEHFQLTNDEGKPFTNDSLKGHWTLMFFGFTNCGYVCPTTMSVLAKMYTNLKTQLPPVLLPHVVLVSVDPDRDTIKRINDYVKTFNPAFHGVRGSLAQTKALASQMNVVFAKVKMTNENYTITHSAEVMLIDPNGKLRAFFSYPHRTQQMLHDYKAIMRNFN